MKYDWMLDVISDLESFALANDMQDLAAELSDLKIVAAADISKKEAMDLDLQTAGRKSQNIH